MKIKSYRNSGITAKLTLFVMLVVIGLISVLGYLFSISSQETFTKVITDDLKTVAKSKVIELENLHKNTKNNIGLLQENRLIKEGISSLTNTVNKDKMSELDVFMKSFANIYDYRCVKLTDLSGKVIYTTNSDGVLGVDIGDPENKAFLYGQKQTFFSDVFHEGGLNKMVVSAPVFSGNKLLTVVVLEMDLTFLHDFILDKSGIRSSEETLFGKKTEDGALFLSPLKKDSAAANYKEVKDGEENSKYLLQAVNGNEITGVFYDYNDEEVIVATQFVPSFKWGLVTKMETKEAFKSINKIKNTLIIAAIVMFCLAIFLSILFSRYLINPIVRLKNVISILGRGNIVENKLIKKGDDEIGEMIDATNDLTDFQKDIIVFAKNIGAGNFDIETKIDAGKGELGQSLIQMGNSLQEAALADKKRNWTSTGLAKFADILSARDEKLEVLTDTINSNLTKYLNANQGSIFIVNDDENESSLELVASYAWDREKHETKKILLGEGLVGRVWKEAEKIYLTDVPEEYINIASGLGASKPHSLLIVPMKIEEKVFGVIELASFNNIEDYQIEFVEKIAENIATTISNKKTNLHTSFLLEESKEMTEELRAQEEEMRQNMEEMQATQEEMDVAQRELQVQHNAINNFALVVEIDSDGNMTYVNDLLCKSSEYSKDELIGKKFSILNHPDMSEAFEDLWNTIESGKLWKGRLKQKQQGGGFYWAEIVITPVVSKDRQNEKYIGVSFDVTEQVEDQEETKALQEEMKMQEEVVCQQLEDLQVIQDEQDNLITKLEEEIKTLKK